MIRMSVSLTDLIDASELLNNKKQLTKCHLIAQSMFVSVIQMCQNAHAIAMYFKQMHRLVVGLAHFFGIHAIVIAHDVHDVCHFVDSSQMAS